MTAFKSDHGGDMFRLVYASRATAPVMAKFEATVADVLAVSKRNNARRGVTGLLLAHKGWFVQALEGPRRNVSQAFSIIGQDDRHGQLELLDGRSAPDRLFGAWNMCAHAITPTSEAVLSALELDGGFDPFRMDGDKALSLLVAISKVPAAQALKKAG